MSGWVPDCGAVVVLGSIPADRLIWFSKLLFSFKVRPKILSPTISEIRRKRLNMSEKLNR